MFEFLRSKCNSQMLKEELLYRQRKAVDTFQAINTMP